VAKGEHLTVLRKGAAIWNEWRACNPDITPDLHHAELTRACLPGVELTEAYLAGADLTEANLRNAELAGANLQFAQMIGTDLSNANLRGIHCAQTNLSKARLSAADLSGSSFTEADLTGADLTGARLLWANFTRANLSGTEFRKVELYETAFADVDLGRSSGLEDCVHRGPGVIDFRTLSRSRDLPLSFLRGCGLPNILIDYLPSLRGNSIQYYSCFISYSAKDQMFADRLHADLQDKGVRCWFAPHDLPIGGKIWDAIDEAIRLRDKLLLILSKASIASEWVEDEVNKAYAEERSRKQVVLFPVRIDNAVISTAEPWAVKLRDQRNVGDFRQWRKPAEYQKSLERLLRDLKASGTPAPND
jgi:TIR domain/Pentapeptide repeats (8 copies)